MKPIRAILAGMLTAFFMQPMSGNAEDIDIYSGLGSTANVPNVMIVMDNAANFSSSAAGATCIIGGVATELSGTVGGIEQCALYNVIAALPVNADGSARINLGMMVYNANNIRDVSNLNCGALSSTGGCLAQPLIPMDAAHKTGLLAWIRSWVTTGGAGNGYVKASGEATAAAMQETWAYYYGNTGLSGRSYAGIKPTAGCQKNFVIFIGNSYSSSGTPGDTDLVTTALNNAPGVTAEQKVQILDTVNTSCPSGGGGSTLVTFPSSAHENKGYYADEWARYMYQADLYTDPAVAADPLADPPVVAKAADPAGVQSITTYTIGILGAACQAEYAATLTSMAHYGGGKYFPTSDYNGLVVAILKILNEVQAVNSVFSSSSLPVSVNAQGTYLNQIFMGMFRPDPGALPRWAGNLKQYQFIINPTSGDLQLGDSVGNSAISGSGTGFMSPDAISFWTCSNSSNPYLTGTNATTGLPNVSAAQLALLTSHGQICASDPAIVAVVGNPPTGFWSNFPSMANSAGKSFDMADGELVEKGGAGQQIRLSNKTDNYATNPATPRKLYTYCPSGASCQAALTHADNAFSPFNAGIAAGLFGSSSTVNISTLTRSGTVATVATSGSHGFSDSDSITIANATQTEYNGTFTITMTDATHFTYPVVEYPPTPATGSYSASIPSSPKTVTLARSGSTVTATSTAHGFSNGATVTISGAAQSDYNDNHVIGGVTANTFTFTVTEKPVTPAAAGGTATGEKNSTGGCPAPCMVSATIASVTRSGTTVTVTTTANHSFIETAGKIVNIFGVLDGTGTAIAGYNGNFAMTGFDVPTNNRSFTFTVATTPATPATPAVAGGSITASTPSAVKAITSLTRSGSTVTVVAAGHGYTTGNSVSIGGTPGTNESPYVGTFTITVVDIDTFTYQVTTTPVTPATGLGGTTMTATRSTGFLATDKNNLINWVRGEDNFGDESSLCPPGTAAGTGNCPNPAVNVRPSVHGDVLHSRPTVLNYSGAVIAITATGDSAGTRTATASAADVAKIGTTGATANIKFSSGNTCAATVASATTFTYSTTNCGVTGAQEVITDSANIVVYYGDNGGVFHAVNGNQVNPTGSTLPAPGTELWGFIPSEHFIKLDRLRSNSPQLNLPSTPPGILPSPTKKNYFVDGPTGVYQVIDSKGKTLKAYLYLSMRRGGRMIYALDVTDPLVPQVLWKKDNTSANMSELGQTWSTPKVARVAGYANPVLIFAAGYDTNQDVDPPPVLDGYGRGIFVLDAITGALVWKATYGAVGGIDTNGNTTWTTSGNTCLSDRMKYSIPSDITLVDRDGDGYIDRLYVGDTGGQVWRVDLEPGGNSAPASWKLHRLASLGECGSDVCRKFFYPPEVINTTGYDAVIVGSGDREHPLYNNTAATGKQNMVFLLKDDKIGNDFNPSPYSNQRISLANGDLFNATSTAYDGTLSGYYINLQDGEKVVNAPLVTAGYVFFGTNQPSAPSTTSCTASLGTARGYRLSPFTASYASVVFAGGGLPPSPVSGVVSMTNAAGETTLLPFLIGGGNPDCTGADCASALGGQKPPISVSTSRTRTYWYKQGK